jgi:hypothetical protein
MKSQIPTLSCLPAIHHSFKKERKKKICTGIEPGKYKRNKGRNNIKPQESIPLRPNEWLKKRKRIDRHERKKKRPKTCPATS